MKASEALDLAVDSARRAGDLLVSIPPEDRTTASEKGRDIKLEADRESERLILGALGDSPFPILSEEAGEVGAIQADKPTWVVDPLDGTFNYSRNQPLCCVSIALVQGNRSLLGVVNDFNRGEIFSGLVENRAAWLNGQPMRVSSTTDAGRAALASGFPVNRDFSPEALEELVGCFRRFKKVRMFGAAALSLAWTACGRVDAYFEEDILFWDVAAGLALVEAAGGYVDIRDSSRLKWGRTVRCGAAPSIWK